MAELATLGIEVQAADVDQAASKLDKLSGAAKRAETAVEGLGPATSAAGRMASQAANATTAHTAALNAQTSAATRSAAALRVQSQAANQNGRTTADTANLAAQGFDIVTTAAGGMSAGLIGMQQGLQIAQVAMASGGGFARSLGAAFVGMLSPVTLLSVGLTTLAAVAVQSLTSWFSSSEETNLSLEKQGQLVSAVAEKWGAATPLIKAYADELDRVKAANDRLQAGDIVAKAQFADAQNAIASVSSEYERMIAVLNARPDTAQYANEMTSAFQSLVAKLAEGNATSIDVSNAQNALRNALTSGQPEVVAFGNAFQSILPILMNAANAMAAIRQEAAGATAATNAALNNPATWRGVGNIGSGDGNIQNGGFMTPETGPTPGRRPLIELEGLPKISGGRRSAANENYENAIRSSQERTKAIQAETAAQALLNPSVNDYGFAVAKARAEADLLAAAERDKKAITPELNAQIQQTATALATATAAQARLTEETKKAQEYTNFLKSTTSGFVNELRQGLRSGEGFWKAFGNAALSVLDRITDRLLNQVMDAIFQVNGAAGGSSGGGIFGFIGSLFGGGSGGFAALPSVGPVPTPRPFSDGGYTGNAAAHVAAGIVHGGEYVFSKKATDRIGVKNLEGMHKRAKGYASGGHVSPVVPANSNAAAGAAPITIDARTTIQASGNADTDSEMRRWAAKRDAELPGRVVQIVKDAQKRRAI